MTSNPHIRLDLDEDGNPVVPVVLGSIDKPTLSATALSNYEVCGRRGQYYHDQTIPKGPPTPNMIRGTVWHQMMEWWNIQHKANGPEFKVFWPNLPDVLYDILTTGIEQAMDQHKDEWAALGIHAEVMAELLDVAADLGVMTRSFLGGSDETHWTVPGIEVIAHEEMLYVEDFQNTEVDFVGYADVVLRVPGITGVVGVDYKATGKAWGGAKGGGDPRKIIQPPLYAEAWEVMHGEVMDWFVMDVMTKAGKFQRVWVPTAPDVRKPFITRWQHVADEMILHREANTQHPTNPSHFLCSEDYCDYWSICEMGEQLTTDIGLTIRSNA